jgi:hypothetical protein
MSTKDHSPEVGNGLPILLRQQHPLLPTGHCAHWERYRHFPTGPGRVAGYPNPS